MCSSQCTVLHAGCVHSADLPSAHSVDVPGSSVQSQACWPGWDSQPPACPGSWRSLTRDENVIFFFTQEMMLVFYWRIFSTLTSLRLWYLEKSKVSVVLGWPRRAADSISCCSSSSITCTTDTQTLLEMKPPPLVVDPGPVTPLYLQVVNHDGVVDVLTHQVGLEDHQTVKGNSDVNRIGHISHIRPEIQLREEKTKTNKKRIECVFGVFSHICLLISRIKKRIKCHIYLHLWSTLSSGLYCGSTSDMSSRSLMRASWTSSLGTMRSTWCLQKENHCGLQVFAQVKARREERSWPTQVDGRFLQTNWCQNNSCPTKLTLQAKTWDMRHQLLQISS